METITNTSSLIRLIINDAAHNEPHPLMGMCDWLVEDKCYNWSRLIRFAERSLHLPLPVILNTINAIYGVSYEKH